MSPENMIISLSLSSCSKKSSKFEYIFVYVVYLHVTMHVHVVMFLFMFALNILVGCSQNLFVFSMKWQSQESPPTCALFMSIYWFGELFFCPFIIFHTSTTLSWKRNLSLRPSKGKGMHCSEVILMINRSWSCVVPLHWFQCILIFCFYIYAGLMDLKRVIYPDL